DSEENHRIARRDMGLRTIIPPGAGRKPKDKKAPPGGRWRRDMKRLLRTKRSRRRCGYTQRWQSETVNSMVKRNLGSALRARTPQRRECEMLLRAVVHDVMLLRRRRGEGRDRAEALQFQRLFEDGGIPLSIPRVNFYSSAVAHSLIRLSSFDRLF